ncbi:hypothetical protein F4859DRAFT_486495 [Xylaria cf. heliscus]|nr:hypothetical protein F4859DRAFT_486495 [Xylaria cf. heliscus]
MKSAIQPQEITLASHPESQVANSVEPPSRLALPASPTASDEIDQTSGNENDNSPPNSTQHSPFEPALLDQPTEERVLGQIDRLQMRFMGAPDRKLRVRAPRDTTIAPVIAKINCMEWEEFAGSRPDVYPTRRRDIFAIDVLVGEPHITTEIEEETTAEDHESTQQIPSKMSGATNECKSISDSTKFRMRSPERVRLNSQQLIRFLCGNGSSKFITITRPFRALFEEEERIRAFYHELELEAAMPSVIIDAATDSIKEQPPDPVGTTVTTSKTTTLETMGCLVKLMDEYILPRAKFVRELDCTRIYFDELWHLFRPGDLVFSLMYAGMAVDIGIMRVICVQGVEHRAKFRRQGVKGYGASRQSPFEIECVAINFDGRRLGPVLVHLEVDHFEGEKAVRSLPVIPINRLRDEEVQQQLIQNGIYLTGCQDEILQSLIDRGKAFFDMTEMKHMHFSGTTNFGEEIDCPVMIDFERAFTSPEAQGRWYDGQRHQGWKPELLSLVEWTPPQAEGVESYCKSECCRGHEVIFDRHLDRDNSAAYLDSLTRRTKSKMHSLAIHPRSRQEANAEENRIKDDEFLIMSAWVHGFVFQIRNFRTMNVSKVTSIKGSNSDLFDNKSQTYDREEAFDQLVLPPGHQNMIKSLIFQHFKDKQTPSVRQDRWDLVRGKGKGLVILLHGAPGVGKTTTAECVADYFKKPLFQLTCGDLGMWADQVESTLQKTFALAGRWGCILLLDEADVFLSARTPTDLLRNSIVSVFLRVIEYYSGILFLTTNRVGDFDEAFASRIHMSLYYPPLDMAATMEVFNLNLDRLQRRFNRKGIELEIERTKVLAYATQHWYDYPGARWNGRQIRNACQTALALAEFEAQGGNHEAVIGPKTTVNLKVKHFETVANSYLGFMNYLTDIYGVNLDERAKENFMRAGVRSNEVTGPPNPLLLRKHKAEPPPHQSFDRYPQTRYPPNPSAQTPGMGHPYQQPYSQPNDAGFQTNMAMPHMYTQYPQNQAQTQQTPASGFVQSNFITASRPQTSTYLKNSEEGLPQTSEQAQQIQQSQHPQPTNHTQMMSSQANGPPIQPNPPITAGPSYQHVYYPTASQVWPQNQG